MMTGESPDGSAADRWLVPLVARIIIFVGLLVSALDRAVLQHRSFELAVTVLLGFSMFVAGLSIYFLSRMVLGRFFSERVRVVRGHKLVTGGLYRYIRHPIYLGEILYFLSIPLIFSSIYGLMVMIAIIPMLLYRIGHEERFLLSKFGKEYEEYRRGTWKLIPYLY